VAAEQFNIMVTSGDYPDLIETAGSFYNGGAAAAIEDDVIIDLNSVVDQYMPNYLAYLNLDETGGARKAVTTVNGQLHMIGYYIEQFYNAGTIIRQDWLDEVGLDAPVTYDDMHDVLEAFSVAGHSNALWISYNGYTRNNAFSGGANVIFDSDQDPLIVNNGVVEYSPITEDTRSFITMLNQWWNEGLIYSDFITQDPSLDYPEDSVATTKAGIMVDDCDKMLYFEGLADDIDLAAIANPRINAGDTAHVGLKHQYTQGGISVSTQCENVELAAKWLDYLFTYDGYVLGNFGVEGEGLQFDENGEPEYTDLVMNNPDMTTIACTVIYSKYGGAGVCNGTRELRNYTDEQWAAIDTWSANVDSANMYPYEDIMTYDENTEYANLLNEIAIYVDENLSKFIVGDRSLDEWDSYVNTLKGMGVDDMTAIAQTAYDRYLAQ
jgi:putative aldouronate transport system substrate-binding protein